MKAAVAMVILLTVHACTRSSLIGDIPVTIENNLVLVATQVNGSPPLTFILDTGAGAVVLDNRRAAELGMTPSAGPDAQTGGGSVEAGEVRDVTVQVGDAALPGITVITLDLRPLDAGLGRRIDGILGYEMFAKYVVEIDYAAQRVRLHDPARYRASAGDVLPIELIEQLPIAQVDLIGMDERTVQAKVEIDTGLTGALTLTRAFVEGNRLVAAGAPRLRITTGALLPGQVSAEVVRIPGMRLGRVDLPRIVASVTPTSDEAGVSGDVVGLVGGDIFRRFTLVIDYSRTRLLLTPSGSLNEADEFDMTGMSLAALLPEGYRVRAVIDGSPAAEAGVRAGDVITMLDGRSARDITLWQIRARFQREGVTYVLGLQREGGREEVTVTTRRLI